MADDNSIIVQLGVEGQEKFKKDMIDSSKSVDGLDKDIKELYATLDQSKAKLAGMKEGTAEFNKLAKEVKATEIAMTSVGSSVESAKTQLRNMNKEIVSMTFALSEMKKAGLQGTQQFKVLESEIQSMTKKAGNLKDTISDVSDTIRNAGSDTAGLDKALRAVTTLSSGFQIVQGASALFGKENEDLQKTLVKLNAVMSITQGLQSIQAELLKNDSIFTLAATRAKQAFNLVVGEGSIALKGFRLALAATGIGLAIILITELYMNWDKLKTVIFGTTQSLDDFKKKQDEIRERNKKSLEDYKTEIEYLVNIKKLTREAADLKISEKRRVVEEDLRQSYEENKKKLAEYEQAIKNVTFAKEDGITTSELEMIRSQQKYIPTQKELLNQREKTRMAELDYKDAVNDRISAEEKGVEKTAKGIKKIDDGVKEIQAKLPLKIIAESETENGFQKLEDLIKVTEQQLISLFSASKILGENPTDNPQIVYLIKQLDDLKRKLATTKAEYDALINPSRATQRPVISAIGGVNKQKSIWDVIFGTKSEGESKLDELKRMAGGAQKIVDNLFSYGNQISDIATQAINIETQNQLGLLEEKKKKGLITEKQYEKESARIKTEAAEKQRAVQIAMAVAQIPQAVLSAYISALQIPVAGLALAPILATVAGAFAAAQVALIASAPLPKFRTGGSVAEKLGLINGKKHEQGGVPIEVEGGEYVVKSQAVQKYGVKILDDINNMRFNPVLNADKRLKAKQSNDYKLNENLATISSYLRQGYKLDSKGNYILSEIRDSLKTRKVYV